jgi:hypothetical protein
MKTHELVAEILRITDAGDLKVLQGALNTQLRSLQAEVRKSFKVGDKVTFTSKGEVYLGEVVKLNPKTVVVLTTHGTKWRVTPTLLTKDN